MKTLSVFLKKKAWQALQEAISQIVGMPGRDDSDDISRRHAWDVFGLEIVAIDEPDLDDDQGIPFSSFSSQVNLTISNMDYPHEADALRHAFAALLVLRLRSHLDPDTRLVLNLQREIVVIPSSSIGSSDMW